MSLIGLLDGLQDPLVYPEADGDGEQRQADVGEDADDAADGQGEQQQQGGAEHHARRLHVAPVQQLHHWGAHRDTVRTDGDGEVGF